MINGILLKLCRWFTIENIRGLKAKVQEPYGGVEYRHLSGFSLMARRAPDS